MIKDPIKARIKETFSERFKKIIEAKGKTKEKVAEDLGCNESTIYSWLNPNEGAPPEWNKICTICKVYNVTPEHLLFSTQKHYNPDYAMISELTGLSSPAIETLCHEASEVGDNRRIVILDYLLSNHELFNDLMDNILLLYQDTQIAISRKNPPKPLLDPSGDWIVINRENLDKLSYEQPDTIYQNIRNILSRFIKEIPQKTISPGEFHSIGVERDKEIPFKFR